MLITMFAAGIFVGSTLTLFIWSGISFALRKREERKAKECEYRDILCEEEKRFPKLRELKLVGNEVHWRIQEDEDDETK